MHRLRFYRIANFSRGNDQTPAGFPQSGVEREANESDGRSRQQNKLEEKRL
jgi:hypothetical protein